MSKKQSTFQFVLLAFFLAIETILAFTPLGFVPIGAIYITTMHIPVILAGCLMGPKYGGIMGFVFGLYSVIVATMTPSVTSFLFSPFISFGPYTGNFKSLLIAFIPRILLGVLSGIIYQWLMKHWKKKAISASVSAAVNTLIHTVLVLSMIYFLYGTQYQDVLGIVVPTVFALIGATLAANGIFEIIAAAAIVPAVLRLLEPIYQKRVKSSS